MFEATVPPETSETYDVTSMYTIIVTVTIISYLTH